MASRLPMAEVMRALRLWLTTAVRAAPLLVVTQCVLAALQAATAPAQTYGVKLLVDGLTTGETGLIAWGVGVIVAGFGVSFIGLVVSGPVQDTTAERVFGRVFADVLDTTTAIPGITHHERPDIADKLGLIRENAWKLGVSFEVLLFMVATVANTVTVLVILGSVHPLLLLLPLLGTARIWSAYLSVQWQQNAFESVLPQARLVDKLMDIIKEPRHAVELRVFGLRQALVDRLAGLQDVRSQAESRAVRRAAWLDGTVRIVFGVAYAAGIVWALSMARAGRLTPGDVALVILVAPQVDQLAGGIAGNIYWLGEVVRSFRRYDWLKGYARTNSWAESVSPAPDELGSGIRLDGVEFAYPGAANPVLADVDLFLPAGSTVALVGENGAGKTTLVKLLARMYDPTQGSVLVDGVDLRTIDPGQWRERISAGFQDFTKFEFCVREAVGIGDLRRFDDAETIQAALYRADAEVVVAGLPRGLDQQLGKRFDGGRDLSGGQWQRLALARAFMRTEPLVLLLDEPTAALDPEAEHALFDRFAAASKQAARSSQGITVLVSHRFSTVRMADLIVVMDGGRVLEAGTHDELMANGLRYAELFSMQADAYR